MARRGRRYCNNHRGKVTPQADKERIVQVFAMTGNKAETSRCTGYTWATIQKVLKEAERDPELKTARALAMDALAGKANMQAESIIDSIAPNQLESGLIKTHDDEGKLVSAKRFGPTLTEKATAAAILIDKTVVLANAKRDLLAGGTDTNKLPLPENIQDAVKAIAGRVKQLSILNVQFESAHPELETTLAAVEAATGEDLHTGAVDADYEELDLDNVAIEPSRAAGAAE